MKIVSTVYQSNPNAVIGAEEDGHQVDQGPRRARRSACRRDRRRRRCCRCFLKANDLKESDINLINMPSTSMVPSLLQGQVDAILGSIDAYQIQLEAQGAQLDNLPLRRLRRARRSARRSSPATPSSRTTRRCVRKFIAASLKGWSFALDNPDKAVKDLKTVFPEVNEKLATAELAAITPLFCSGGAKFIGKAEDAQWVKTQELLVRGEAAAGGPGPEELLHQRLPAAGVADARLQVLSRSIADDEEPSMSDRTTSRAIAMPTCTSGWHSAARGAPSPMPTWWRSPGSPAIISELHTSDVYAQEQPVRPPRRARHARARLRPWPDVGAHRRVARDGDRLPRHQRVEVRRADLRRRHDLRELRDRRTARQQVEARRRPSRPST